MDLLCAYVHMYCAELDEQNIVVRVIVADSLDWCTTHLGGTWVETFIDKPGHTYAGMGWEYLAEHANFRIPSPGPSWTFDVDSWEWIQG